MCSSWFGASAHGARSHGTVPHGRREPNWRPVSGCYRRRRCGFDGSDVPGPLRRPRRRRRRRARGGHLRAGRSPRPPCSTPAAGAGRVAIELARHGIEVIGVDVSPSMLAEARRRAPDLTWIEADLTTLALGRRFDVVVLAGNVPLFTPPGTADGAGDGVRRPRARRAGADRRLPARPAATRLAEYDAAAASRRLRLLERWGTWDRAAVRARRRLRRLGAHVRPVARRPGSSGTGGARRRRRRPARRGRRP